MKLRTPTIYGSLATVFLGSAAVALGFIIPRAFDVAVETRALQLRQQDLIASLSAENHDDCHSWRAEKNGSRLEGRQSPSGP